MHRSSLRRIARLLIAFFMFAQGSVALAACAMERGSMAPAMEMAPDAACDCGAVEVQAPSAGCVAHCVSDLQLSGLPVVLVHAATTPVLLLEKSLGKPGVTAQKAPPAHVPRRILLHSFLI